MTRKTDACVAMLSLFFSIPSAIWLSLSIIVLLLLLFLHPEKFSLSSTEFEQTKTLRCVRHNFIGCCEISYEKKERIKYNIYKYTKPQPIINIYRNFFVCVCVCERKIICKIFIFEYDCVVQTSKSMNSAQREIKIEKHREKNNTDFLLIDSIDVISFLFTHTQILITKRKPRVQ